MGRPAIDLAGQRFGRLVALARVGTQIAPKCALWLCRCDCGREVLAGSDRLRHWKEPACERCGPICSREKIGKDPAYLCWRGMIQRCEDPRTNGYRRYGGRGIRVCERWRKSFVAFLADVGPRPTLPDDPRAFTLDRIDNDGDYEPGNVRWVTWREQAQNRCDNRLVEFNGETLPLVTWCDRLGLDYVRTYERLRRGWNVAHAFGVPRLRRGVRTYKRAS